MTKKILRAVFTVLLPAVCLMAVTASADATQRLERHVTVDRIDRQYIAYIPDSASQRGPLPVVLAFHGGFQTAEGLEDLVHLEDAQQARNFIIVYPSGYKRYWNEDRTCCGAAMKENIDDVKFVRVLLNDLESVAQIDRHRIYATGYSNGGGLSYYLACVMADQIAAIAPISSNMREKMIADCHPSRAVPVFEWHGLLDHYSPYGGGMTVAKDTAPVPPVQETIGFWKTVDGTQGVTHQTMFGGAVDCDVYSDGWNNAVVQQCRVPNMGHRWPGAEPTTLSQRGDFFMRMVRGELGPYSSPMDANDAILEFFSRYKLP